MDDPNTPAGLWQSVGAMFAGIIGVRGYDRFRRSQGDDKPGEVVVALRDVAQAVRDEGSLTRDVIHATTTSTREAINAGAKEAAELTGYLKAKL